jgi:hypothetical protein
VTDSTLEDDSEAVTASTAYGYEPITSPTIKRGDKIVDALLGTLTVDEIMEMYDLGGTILGYRVRAD